MTIPGPTATLRISGPDAERFLSGQITQDLSALSPGETRYTFICDAKGRIQFHATITKEGDDFLVQTESANGEDLQARLDRYLIADDCTLELVSTSTPANPNPEATLKRLQQAIPARQDLVDALPAETGLLEVAVSFTKGCYQGQEVISRMKRAGKTNRQLQPVFLLEKPSASPLEFFQPSVDKPLLVVTSASELEDGTGRFPALGYLSQKADPSQPFTSRSGLRAELT